MTAAVPVINRFRLEYHFLSNFSPATLVWRGRTWATVEHAYQAAKTNDARWVQHIAEASGPGEAKQRGNDRTLPLLEDWNALRDGIMFELLQIKFAEPSLRSRLVATSPAILIEGNTWHDNYWGDCYCARCASRSGRNRLGELLMAVRNRAR